MSDGGMRSALRLVADRDQHSVRVPPRRLTQAQAAELEATATVLYAATVATRDLQHALETQDVHDTIAAQRRLIAAAGLAKPSADRLERTLNG